MSTLRNHSVTLNLGGLPFAHWLWEDGAMHWANMFFGSFFSKKRTRDWMKLSLFVIALSVFAKSKILTRKDRSHFASIDVFLVKLFLTFDSHKHISIRVTCILGCLLPTFSYLQATTPEISDIRSAIYEGIESDSIDIMVDEFLALKNSSQDSLSCYVETGNSYRNVGDIERSLHFLDAATENSYAISKTLGKAYLAKALLYRSVADELSAQENYERAIEIFLEVGEEGNLLSACYQNLGKIYHRLGAYEKASELFFHDLALGLSEEDSIRNYIELGNLWALGLEQAVVYYEQALSFEGISDEYKATVYINLAELYASEYEKMEKASLYINQAFPLLEKNYENDPRTGNFHFFDAFRTLGDIHTAAEEYDEANIAYNDALEFGQAAYGTIHRREIGKLYVLKGKLASLAGSYEESLDHFQQALKCVIPGFKPKSNLESPVVEDLYTENVIVEALIGKAEASEGKYHGDKSQAHLEYALTCYEQVHEVGKLFRRSYSYESSKLLLAAEHHLWNEKAISTAYQLYQLTQDSQFAKQAFIFSERSKAWVLLELMKDATAKVELEIHESLLARERYLKQEIMGYEDQIHSFAEQVEFVSEIKTEKFRAQRALEVLIDSLELLYPRYHTAKYEFEELTVESVQGSLLEDSQNMIEYFWGQDEYVYAFIIGRETFEMKCLGKVDELEKEIHDFYSVLQKPQAIEAYQQHAYSVYKKLLAPLQSTNHDLSERLVIVPDGPLGYLPFDALLEEEITGKGRMKRMPFLLRSHSISYVYSGNLLKEVVESTHKKASRNFLGIGPEFKGSDQFSFLAYSVEEIEQIKATLGRGDLLIRNQATKSRFLEKAPEFGILHISSHASVDDEDPMSSWIAFWQEEKGENNLLSVRDLYTTTLEASLAVLGACETGYGDIHHGEGIMSLARGFTFAGCKSLIATLWKANHWSTHKIMKEFYAHLAEEIPKDQALRQAKLAYIDSEEVDQNVAHPYYWAAATPIGDMEVMELEEGWGRWTLWISLVMILVLLWRGKKLFLP